MYLIKIQKYVHKYGSMIYKISTKKSKNGGEKMLFLCKYNEFMEIIH